MLFGAPRILGLTPSSYFCRLETTCRLWRSLLWASRTELSIPGQYVASITPMCTNIKRLAIGSSHGTGAVEVVFSEEFQASMYEANPWLTSISLHSKLQVHTSSILTIISNPNVTELFCSTKLIRNITTPLKHIKELYLHHALPEGEEWSLTTLSTIFPNITSLTLAGDDNFFLLV